MYVRYLIISWIIDTEVSTYVMHLASLVNSDHMRTLLATVPNGMAVLPNRSTTTQCCGSHNGQKRKPQHSKTHVPRQSLELLKCLWTAIVHKHSVPLNRALYGKAVECDVAYEQQADKSKRDRITWMGRHELARERNEQNSDTFMECFFYTCVCVCLCVFIRVFVWLSSWDSQVTYCDVVASLLGQVHGGRRDLEELYRLLENSTSVYAHVKMYAYTFVHAHHSRRGDLVHFNWQERHKIRTHFVLRRCWWVYSRANIEMCRDWSGGHSKVISVFIHVMHTRHAPSQSYQKP